MSIKALEHMIITDDDINWVEKIMGSNIKFDESRRNAIKNLDSIDVQAFPGSGKTTLLVAKLAILSQKWQSPNSGICVLSHTNVAREEIENRLGNTDIGRRLLSYPHFIGTFHSFFDIFIAIPWLKSNGFEINRIDTEFATSIRWRKLNSGTQTYFKRNYKDYSLCQYSTEIGKINWNKGGKTCDEVINIIKLSQEHGIFTYNEMLLYAKKALSECKSISDSIQSRFPILFIDEAQDTNAFLWDLLINTFNQNNIKSIRQGFGDINQAIYGSLNEEDEVKHFPRNNALVLEESKRFNDVIAKLANTVSITDSEMTGTSPLFSDREIKNSILLFDRKNHNLKNVIDTFGQLVIDTFTDREIIQYKHEGIHAIGMVHEKKEETSDAHFPKGVFDYWKEYRPLKKDNISNPKLLIGYFRNGIESFKSTKENYDQINWIVKGVGRVINKAKNDRFITLTGNILLNIMSKLDYSQKALFRKHLKECVDIKSLEKKSDWKKIVTITLNMLTIFDLKPNDKVNTFLEWQECDSFNNIKTASITRNCYTYSDSNNSREVVIEFGNIHSVKGRTHLATLVLETYYKTHNIKSILDYLCNTPPKKTNSTNAKRLKCQYVAMTRARGLVCLAIPEEFVDNQRQIILSKSGWNIIKS